MIKETTENKSVNKDYRFGQEKETYNIIAAYSYFGRLFFLVSTILVNNLNMSSATGLGLPENKRTKRPI